jgi:RimJ/RimL family protein N-acetyltransferase
VPDGSCRLPALVRDRFELEPLGPQHNERDYAAWSSSMEHIRSTPGLPFADDPWPQPMTLDENLADLEGHRRDFEDRTGFTYTVLDPTDGDVIGCVYIYPARDDAHDASVRSWVRATHAELDAPLWRAVSQWLAADWPFAAIDYAPREDAAG